jgi:hypothetical protein
MMHFEQQWQRRALQDVKCNTGCQAYHVLLTTGESTAVCKDDKRKTFALEVEDSLGRFVGRIRIPNLAST